MMQTIQREKVADNVYYFQSESYALVTAGVIVGPQWAVLIDTLSNPDESQDMRRYIEQELGVRVRYTIDTHYHADHSWGNCFFSESTIISSSLCRDALERLGQPSLEVARKQSPIYKQVQIVFPHITFDKGYLSLQVGKKNLNIIPLPGHTPDSIGVFVEEDRVLFAGDLFMEIPFIVDGNIDDLEASLHEVAKMGLENVVQGHGDIILRGEIDGAIKENLNYLSELRKIVMKAHEQSYPGDYLMEISVEDCGKSRVLIGGLAEELHQRNLKALYRQTYNEFPAVEEFDDEDD